MPKKIKKTRENDFGITVKTGRPRTNFRRKYEKLTGTKIKKSHEVHHIDLDPYNNDIENLVALKKQDHQLLHSYIKYMKSKKQFEDMKYRMKEAKIKYLKSKNEIDLSLLNRIEKAIKERDLQLQR